MTRVRITSRPDGLGLEVSGLEHAKVRRLVLVADPLVPPRVFLELLGHEVDIDLGAVLADEPGADGLSPAAAAVTESPEEFRDRTSPAPPVCWTCGGAHESPPPPPPTPSITEGPDGWTVPSMKSGRQVTLAERQEEERDRRADWCRAHGGRS